MPNIPQVGLVIPIYNEELRFNKDYFKSLLSNQSLYILFIDDGSTDNSFKIIKHFSSQNERVDFHRLPKNVGKGEAVRQGVLKLIEESPDLRMFGYLDSDGAFSKFDVHSMCDLAMSFSQSEIENQFKIVISSRLQIAGRTIERSNQRHFIGRFVHLLIYGARSPVWDSQSGFKLFLNCHSNKELFIKPFSTKWLFDMEILHRAIGHRNYCIYEYPVKSWTEVKGSKIKAKSYINILFEILKIKMILRG